MKIRVLIFAACALFAWTTVRAAEGQPKPGGDDDDMTELGEHMEKMGSAFKRLNRQIADPSKNDDSLKRVAIMRENAEAALKLEPAKTADLPAEKRAKFVEDFHQGIHGLIADIDKLEAALKAGNNEEAKKALSAMKQDQREGHKEFQKQKPHKM